MPRLNKTDIRTINRTRTDALPEAAVTWFYRGELIFDAIRNLLFVGDGTNDTNLGDNVKAGNTVMPVQTLDMAVTHDDGVVVHSGDVIYDF